MRFFPWLIEEFTSPLPSVELLHRVQRVIAPPQVSSWRTLFANQPAEPFRGHVTGNSFELTRIIGYRNSMLPQITGWVQAESAGSRVRLQHRLHLATLVFGVLWLGIVGLVAGGLLLGSLTARAFEPAIVIPVGMLVFGLLLFTVPFWLEVGKSRPLLVELLQLTPTVNS